MKRVLLILFLTMFIFNVFPQYKLPGYGDSNKKKTNNKSNYKIKFEKISSDIIDIIRKKGKYDVSIIFYDNKNHTKVNSYLEKEFVKFFLKINEINIISNQKIKNVLSNKNDFFEYFTGTGIEKISNQTKIDFLIIGDLTISKKIINISFQMKSVSGNKLLFTENMSFIPDKEIKNLIEQKVYTQTETYTNGKNSKSNKTIKDGNFILKNIETVRLGEKYKIKFKVINKSNRNKKYEFGGRSTRITDSSGNIYNSKSSLKLGNNHIKYAQNYSKTSNKLVPDIPINAYITFSNIPRNSKIILLEMMVEHDDTDSHVINIRFK